MLRHLLVSLFQVLLEFLCRLLWEYLMQPHADRVHFLPPDRVLLLATSLEVHEDFVLRYRACHQLSVTAEDVSAFRFHADTVAFQTVCHIRPVLFLRRHDIEGFANDGKSHYSQYYSDRHISWHYFIIVELTHDGLLFW